MTHLQNLGDYFSIPTVPDLNGYIGRECPAPSCEGYFKITPGTGLSSSPQMYCPYCGNGSDATRFATKAQVEYAKSVVLNQLTGALLKDLQALEFEHRPRGGFGIGISMKVEGQPLPIRQYREDQLETEVVCDNCSLRYAIYGVFAFCPDCLAHNSHQILGKNLEVAEKVIALASGISGGLVDHLIGDALENAVAAFDGFGREACRVQSPKTPLPAKAPPLSFQNLEGVRKRIQVHYGFDLADGLPVQDWEFVTRCFQKRHLLSHRMGVVDQDYLDATNDPHAVLGRKIVITADEVTRLLGLLKDLGSYLLAHL